MWGDGVGATLIHALPQQRPVDAVEEGPIGIVAEADRDEAADAGRVLDQLLQFLVRASDEGGVLIDLDLRVGVERLARQRFRGDGVLDGVDVGFRGEPHLVQKQDGRPTYRYQTASL